MSRIEDKLAADLAYVNRKMETWVLNRTYLEPIADKFEAMDASCEVTSTSLDVSLAGDKKKFQEMFKVLRAFGYKCDKEVPEKFTDWSGYWYKDNHLTIWVYFTSTVCKRVQVGTEIKEMPIYEVQCDGNDGINQD